jgi:type II secretory pathway component GspD/PulD (secretin)
LWWRCDPSPGLTLQKDGLPQLQLPTTEENATTLTLPKPCDGEKPPMAMIEVTMIRTEESMVRQQGINLLDGLKIVKDTFFNSNNRRVIGNDAVITTSAASLIYSLNIANSLFAKNEVIARPSLSAVDRLPSVFFSGRTVSIASGTINTGFTLSDKSVGTSLSITPTFMDDDNVLLSIRSSRSFIEPTEGGSIALIQSRNAVNASARVRFGQTYVLNGMIEREKDAVNTGVPILMDIPIIQNLFAKSVKIDFNRQILTLVTVRRLVDDNDSIHLAKNPKGTINGHKLAVQVQEFVDLQANQTVMDEVLNGLKNDNSLYQRLRRRDVIQESYSSQSVIKRLLTDLKELSYF